MLSIIRKNQHSLTFFIVLLTIVSFIWLYNRTNLSQVGANDVALVYGHVLQRAELEHQIADYRLAMALGLTDFVRDLGGFAENEEVALTSFIFNVLVIQHEAPRLNIVPSDEKIAETIQNLPVFQTEGTFDSAKYALFMQEQLLPRGLTERHLEEVIRDSLSLKKLYQLITAPVIVSEAQEREAARIYQSVIAQVLHFDQRYYLNNLPKDAVTAAEKKEFYEKNKTLFMSEEERVVSYLSFTLPAPQQKLQGKERVKALQQLSDAAATFKQQSQEAQQQGKNFGKSAAEYGLKVITTDPFKKTELETTTSGSSKKIPSELITTSFKLSNVGAISEVIQSGDNFYLISLTQIIPSRPLTLTEVDSRIEKMLREQKASQKTQEAATKAFNAVREAMLAGKKFPEAIASLGQKWATLSGNLFQKTPPLSEQEQQYLAATVSLNEGEMSELHHAPWGDFIVYLQQRLPLSNNDWNTHHARIERELLEQQRRLLFFEWLHQARTEAKINMLDRHHRRSLFSSIFGK
ncbi:MAG: SurA N-terminal domain-containing protein [Chthoniobacterales bacterium]